jgi:hypothetical protein
MPVSYRVEESTGFVLSRGSEVVKGDELSDHLSALVADPNVPRPLRDLHDLRSIEQFDVEQKDIIELVATTEEHLDELGGARLAVIATSDHAYGMSRMMQLLTDVSPAIERIRAQGGGGRMHVFRDIEEARRWLAQPEGDSAP